jgi:peptidoglycan hydrolase-like protein with peptidoglycan-binding domain
VSTSAAKPVAEKKTSAMRTRESPAGMSRDDIKQAQKSLNDKGFDVGPSDGVMGSRTRAGIRQFQKSENLPVTGRLDAETAGKLGVGTESIAGNF